MATNFPTSLDSLTNPNSTDELSSPSHSQQHSNLNDSVEAIESKIGVNNSTDVNSIQYKVSALQTLVGDLDNSTDAVVELLGLEGNNDLTVNGIENKTTLDSFNKTVIRTVKYNLQISRGSSYETSEFLILNDGTDVHVSQSNIVSNSNNSLVNVTFEENSGIIGLCVTPTAGAITARYIRTAIKI
jgi:hypothetical protein